MNKNMLTVYIGFILVSLCLVTVAAAFVKPSINKTVVLQIQKYVKQ